MFYLFYIYIFYHHFMIFLYVQYCTWNDEQTIFKLKLTPFPLKLALKMFARFPPPSLCQTREDSELKQKRPVRLERVRFEFPSWIHRWEEEIWILDLNKGGRYRGQISFHKKITKFLVYFTSCIVDSFLFIGSFLKITLSNFDK